LLARCCSYTFVLFLSPWSLIRHVVSAVAVAALLLLLPWVLLKNNYMLQSCRAWSPPTVPCLRPSLPPCTSTHLVRSICAAFCPSDCLSRSADFPLPTPNAPATTHRPQSIRWLSSAASVHVCVRNCVCACVCAGVSCADKGLS